ncbi:MAG: BPL-N domain-containing protein [Proteobacteria bacterium]|nr:BPL-N domain-containing protein [Pseudomonadota bacterium]
MKKSLLSLVVLCSHPLISWGQLAPVVKPLALIYQGPGSCEDTKVTRGCSEMSAHIAELAGFRTKFVGPEGVQNPGDLTEAKVWIQPGGRARKQILAMTPQALEQIRNFVARGGGYIGFCAGAFLATEKFGWGDKEKDEKTFFEAEALGLLPGHSRYFGEYDEELNENLLAKILDVSWNGKRRSVYWELGPYFDETTLGNSRVKALAYYPSFEAQQKEVRGMTVQATYGRGRVSVTAVHPEADSSWRKYYGIQDKDGLDFDLAVEMVKWATQQQTQQH